MAIKNTFKILLIAALSSCAYGEDVTDTSMPSGSEAISPIPNESKEESGAKDSSTTKRKDCQTYILSSGDCLIELTLCDNKEIKPEDIKHRCAPLNKIFPKKDLPRPPTNNLRQNKTELF